MYQCFEADFAIIKSRRHNGIKVRSIFGIIMYVNHYGGRETGSSYNFRPVADRNVISNAITIFSGVAVTMQYRLSCNFIEINVKFNMAFAIQCGLLPVCRPPSWIVGEVSSLSVLRNITGSVLIVIRTVENRMRIRCLVTFLYGSVNRPDFWKISIAFTCFRLPYWISGAT